MKTSMTNPKDFESTKIQKMSTFRLLDIYYYSISNAMFDIFMTRKKKCR